MCQDCSSPDPAGSGDPDGLSRRGVLKGLGLSGLGLATLTSGLGLAALGLDVRSATAAAPDPALLTLTPRIRPRSSWAGSSCPARGRLAVEAPGDVRFLLVHHTVTPGNDYAEEQVPDLLRGMYRYHVGPDKGWADLAYNFLVDRYGGIWEGRAGSLHRPVLPGATGGSQGFAQLGCFLGDHSRTQPTARAQASMISLLAWLSRKYGVDTRPDATTTFVSRGSNRWAAGTPVTTRTIEGHRSMSLTACPGDAAYPLVLGAFPRGVRRLNGPLPTTDRTAWYSAPGSVVLAERCTDGSVALRTVTLVPGAGAPVAPVVLGGQVVGAPLVVQRPGGPLEVLARGTDSRMWVRTQAGDGTWTAWARVGGAITGPPAAVVVGAELQLFARGTDGSLVVRTSRAPGVHAGQWRSLGGRLLLGSAPAAAGVVAEATDVVVHGTDGAAHRGSLAAGVWSGFRSLGGPSLAGSPSAVAAGGELVVVSVSSTGRPYARTPATDWSGLGGVLFGSAALAAAPDGSGVDAFGTGTNGLTYRNARVGTAWSGWAALPR